MNEDSLYSSIYSTLSATINTFPSEYRVDSFNTKVDDFLSQVGSDSERTEWLSVEDVYNSLSEKFRPGTFIDIAVTDSDGDVVGIRTEKVSSVEKESQTIYTATGVMYFVGSFWCRNNLRFMIHYPKLSISDRLNELNFGDHISSVTNFRGDTFKNCYRTSSGVAHVDDKGAINVIIHSQIKDFTL